MEENDSILTEAWNQKLGIDKLLVVIKAGKAFISDLETLQLNDVFSVLLILKKLVPKVKECQKQKFDVVICFEASEAETVKNWRDLRTVTYQQCDQLLAAISGLSPFDGGRFLVVTEEPLVRMAAVLRQKYSFRGLTPDDVAPYVNKLAIKANANKHRLAVAEYVQLDENQRRGDMHQFAESCLTKLGLPLFAKPQNGCASIGTAIISSEKDLKQWLEQQWSSPNPFVIERLLTGTEFTSYMFVQNGQVSFMRIFRNGFPIGWFVHKAKPLVKVEVPCGHKLYARLATYSTSVVSAWSPVQNGIFFVEFFLDTSSPSSSPVLTEVCCRMPGGLLPEALLKAASVDIEALHIMASFKLVHFPRIEKPYIAYFRFPRRCGKVVSISNLSKVGLKSDYTASWRISVGDELQNPRGLSGRHEALKLTLYNNDYQHLIDDVSLLIDDFHPFEVCQQSESNHTEF